MFLEIPRKIIGVLYEQNKSNETIQRYESDAAIDAMPMHGWNANWYMIHI
mgnify:CR=1 FL=1